MESCFKPASTKSDKSQPTALPAVTDSQFFVTISQTEGFYFHTFHKGCKQFLKNIYLPLSILLQTETMCNMFAF